jgi:hypothetical protein
MCFLFHETDLAYQSLLFIVALHKQCTKDEECGDQPSSYINLIRAWTTHTQYKQVK